MANSPTRRIFAGVALVTATAVGGLTVAALDPIGAVSAQEDPVEQQETSKPRPGRGQILADVLGELVADGTLTQAQADAVQKAYDEKKASVRGQDKGKDGHRKGAFGRWFSGGMDAVAQALGMSADELTAALRDGQSIAQVAESKGVDLRVVIDALLAAANEQIDAAVAEGKIDAEKAERLKSRLAEMVDRFVNSGRGGFGGPGGPFRGPGGEGPESGELPPPAAPQAPSAPPTTATPSLPEAPTTTAPSTAEVPSTTGAPPSVEAPPSTEAPSTTEAPSDGEG